MSTMSFHNGFDLDLANMSQMAFPTAPVAIWMTPFSGPILATAIFVNSRAGDEGRNNPLPTELRVCGKVSPCLAHVGEEVLDFLANDAICDIMNCLTNLSRNDHSWLS